jgi:hypothetical protein
VKKSEDMVSRERHLMEGSVSTIFLIKIFGCIPSGLIFVSFSQMDQNRAQLFKTQEKYRIAVQEFEQLSEPKRLTDYLTKISALKEVNNWVDNLRKP